MTITEIAEKAGVSIGTVDRVIHNRGRVALKTREKVESVIAKYGYSPNPLARQLKCKGEFLIGVLIPVSDAGGYWASVRHGMMEAASLLSFFSVRLTFQFFNRVEHGSAVRAGNLLLKEKPNAYIIAPVVSEEIMRFLHKIEDTPYIFIDSPLAKAAPFTTIVQNPYKAGQCAAKIMYLLKGSGQFICLRMYADAYNLRERYRGFSDFFSHDSASTVIESICPYEKEADVFDFLEELIALYPDTKGLFVSHAEGLIVGKFLTYKGIKADTALIGFDNLPENRKGLYDGSIDCIISQRPEYQGYASVQEIYRHCLLHQERQKLLDIPIDILFKENATDFKQI